MPRNKSGISWRTQDGREIDLVDLESDHLINCIKMVLRNFVASTIKKEEADAVLESGVDTSTYLRIMNYAAHGARGIPRVRALPDLLEEAKNREIELKQHLLDTIKEGAEKAYVLQVASKLRSSAVKADEV